MSAGTIRIAGLGKRYRVGHETARDHHYTALRDVMTRQVRAVARRTGDLLRGRPVLAGTESEEFWALKDITLDIRPGERVGIIGRNGAGKSTLLKILSQITAPTEGRVELHGRVASLLEVGTGFHPELTGRENVFLNGAILGMTRREIRATFDEIVAFAEVERFLDTPVKHYSTGMYMRLAFAVAAHLRPEILVVDEVLAVGDAQFQTKCLAKMDAVSREGRTVLFVSHNLAAMRDLCDRAILLERGHLAAQGPVADVSDTYLAQLRRDTGPFRPLVAPKAQVVGIRLCDVDGRALPAVDTDTTFDIEVTYQVTAPAQVNLVLNLSKDGAYVFQSIGNHDPSFHREKTPGEYVSTCRIPAGLLNDGTFALGLTIFEAHYEQPRTFHDVLAFRVEDGPRVRGDYAGGLVGAVRPHLMWQTRALAR
jgi:lipopolysaccharide transport system ATP-binding protein